MFPKSLFFIIFLCLPLMPLSADPFHYIDIHVGERASGLAGSFTAVADDPSGAYYNPAGLVFVDQSHFSVSTNSFKYSKTTIKNVLASSENQNNNWESSSSIFIPNYFGLVQNYGDIKVAFSFIIPEATEANQDSVTALTFSAATQNRTFVRNYNERNFLYLMGPSIAYEWQEDLAIGASVFLTRRAREFTDNQWVRFPNQSNTWEWTNRYSEEASLGAMTVLGIQYMPSETLSLGFTFKNGLDFSANADQQSIRATPNGTTRSSSSFNLVDLGSKPVPMSFTGGAAVFFSPRLMWTGDVTWYPAHGASNVQFKRKEIINVATGLEAYVLPEVAARFGLYTNKSTLSSPYSGASDIDLFGFTGSLGLETEVSTLSMGINLSWGSGTYYYTHNNSLVSTSADQQNFYYFFSGSYKF